MRDNVLNRLEAEATAYRDHLVSGDFTAEQIVEQSYQFVMKQGIYYVLANHNSNKLSCDEWRWLNLLITMIKCTKITLKKCTINLQ